MDILKKERIALEVIRTLKSKFDDFPEDASDNRNAPFHEAFLEAFKIKIEKYVTDIPIFISLASWMHGLNTSLGQSFFERTAHILSDGEKRKFANMLVSREQQSIISDIIASLKNKTRTPNLSTENDEIFISEQMGEVEAPNFTGDVYFEEDDKIILIELKTVKPNSDIFKEQKNKFLNAKAALFNLFPSKQIIFYLGFPFDPLHEAKTGYDKRRFFNYSVDFKKYFADEEVLLADELWDFLSEEKETMKIILEIINSISKPDFIEKFNFINKSMNYEIDKIKYEKILTEWFLNRELEIVRNYDNLKEMPVNQKSIKRNLSQNLFDHENKYKENRITALINYISK